MFVDGSPNNRENIKSNYNVECNNGDFQYVSPCLKIGDYLKVGTEIKQILNFTADGMSMNISGEFNVTDGTVATGYKFFDRSDEIRSALLNLPNNVLLSLAVKKQNG